MGMPHRRLCWRDDPIRGPARLEAEVLIHPNIMQALRQLLRRWCIVPQLPIIILAILRLTVRLCRPRHVCVAQHQLRPVPTAAPPPRVVARVTAVGPLLYIARCGIRARVCADASSAERYVGGHARGCPGGVAGTFRQHVG